MNLSMEAWRPLTETEEDAAWARFYSEFHFKPSTKPTDWPSVRLPTPSVTWDIGPAFLDPDPLLNTTNTAVNACFLEAFRACEPDPLIVLDWQHQCYEFLHHHEAACDPSDWPIPVIPNGDYYIFLSSGLTCGSFGHPWEQSLSVFGRSLLARIEPATPLQFGPILRRNLLAV